MSRIWLNDAPLATPPRVSSPEPSHPLPSLLPSSSSSSDVDDPAPCNSPTPPPTPFLSLNKQRPRNDSGECNFFFF